MIYFRKKKLKVMGFYDDTIKEHKQLIENDGDNFVPVSYDVHRKLLNGMYKLKKELDTNNIINIEEFDELFETYQEIEFLENEITDVVVSPIMALTKLL